MPWALGVALTVAAPAVSHAQRFEITLSWAVDHVVLGDTEQLEISIRTPAAVNHVWATASTGTLGRARRIAPGRFVANYRPPRKYYPQIAIIAAGARLGDQPLVGWRPLQLWGKGEAQVRGAPNRDVTVLINKRRFGPVRANANGIASVPVIVPPGVRFGMARGERVDLKLPRDTPLHLLVTPPNVSGDRGQPIDVYVFATDDRGRPRDEPRPSLLAFGRPATVKRARPGAWYRRLSVPPGQPAKLELSATLPGVEAARATATVSRGIGQATALRIEPPGKVGPSPVTIRVHVTDGIGQPVQAALTGSADAGRLEAFVERRPGLYEALYRPPTTPSSRTGELRIQLPDGKAQRVELEFSHYGAGQLSPVWFWTSAAASAALLATGIATRVIAFDKSDEYKDPSTSIERRRELKDSGEALTTASTITLVAGGVATAATAVLWWLTDFRGSSSGESPSNIAAIPLPAAARSSPLADNCSHLWASHGGCHTRPYRVAALLDRRF